MQKIAMDAQKIAMEAQTKKTLELEKRLNQQDANIQDIADSINEITETPIIHVNFNVNIDTVVAHISNPTLYINDFKSENSIVDTLEYEQMLYAVQQGGNAVARLVKYKHYNPNLPINHNVTLKQKNQTMHKYFKGTNL